MSVAGISSTSIAAQPGLLGTFQQQRNDFQQLSTALQSGDLTSAQAAFTDLSKLSQNSKTGAQSSASQIARISRPLGRRCSRATWRARNRRFRLFRKM